MAVEIVGCSQKINDITCHLQNDRQEGKFQTLWSLAIAQTEEGDTEPRNKTGLGNCGKNLPYCLLSDLLIVSNGYRNPVRWCTLDLHFLNLIFCICFSFIFCIRTVF